MPKITLNGYSCIRCNYKWFPRSKSKPKVCPKCKSAYWNTPRRRDILKIIKKIVKQENNILNYINIFGDGVESWEDYKAYKAQIQISVLKNERGQGDEGQY